MLDPEQIRGSIVRAREALDAIDPGTAVDELTRQRLDFWREHCEDLIRQLESFLDHRDQ